MQSLGVPLHRQSRDKKTNNHGYRLLDICKNNNLVLVNGRFGPNSGLMTFRNVSVLDYVLSSTEGFPMIDSFNIIETNILHSDGHALIKFALKYTFQHETNMEQTFNTQRNPPWNESQTDDFICNIDVNQIQSLIDDISLYSNEQPNASSNIDIFSERLSHILTDSAQ